MSIRIIEHNYKKIYKIKYLQVLSFIIQIYMTQNKKI